VSDEPEFARLSEARLGALPSEALIDYVAAARAAGDLEAARTASGVLAFGFEPTIRIWVRKDMGSHPDEDIDDVVMDVLASVVHSTFDGKMLGEFGAFLKTIARRRVIDWFRKRERREGEGPLPNEHEGEEGAWGRELGNEDETEWIAGRDLVERMLEGRNPMHAKVIRLYGPEYVGFEGLSAEETVARIDGDASEDTVTVANVHQIWKRFKNDVSKELGLDG